MNMTRRINFMQEFQQGGVFEAFTELVRKHDELELLFRGNSGSNGEAIIYYRNNVVFKLSVSKNRKIASVTINYNHLRYTKNWPDVIKKYNKEYGFPQKEINDVPHVDKEGNKHYGIGYVSSKFRIGIDTIDHDYVESLYALSQSVMEDYFCLKDKEKIIDRFREKCGAPQTGRAKPNYVEKENQQAYFSSTSNIEDGLFVYDLEYKEPFANNAEKKKAMDEKKRKKMNKPDCLAIRFADGKPVSFAFVEIKSNKEAEQGECGTAEHLDGMMDDLVDKEFVRFRIEEADQLIHDYQMLGLKDLSEADDVPDIKSFTDNMETEIIIVYTNDSAKGRKEGDFIAKSSKYKGGIPYKVEIF